MEKPSKNKKIASQVGLENLVKRRVSDDGTLSPLVDNTKVNNTSESNISQPIQEEPKVAKKKFSKPQTNTANFVLNSKQAENPVLTGLEMGYSMLPKSTSSIAAYHLGGVANALGSIYRNADEKLVKAKNSNRIHSDEFANNAVQSYKDRVNASKGKNGENWFSRQINGLDLLVETGLKQAIDYAGIGIGHGLDLPDILQKVKLPNVYDLKDLELTAKKWANDFSQFDQTFSNNLLLGTIYGDKELAKKRNQKVQDTYDKNNREIKLAQEQNKARANKAIQDGTYEQKSRDFYTEKLGFLGKAIDQNLNAINTSAKLVDKYIFQDEDSSESWLSSMSNNLLEGDNQIRRQAQFELDQEAKKEVITKKSSELKKKYGNDMDKFTSEMNKVYKQVYDTPQRSESLLSENWDKDNRNFFTKILDPDSYSGFQDIVDVDNKVMPMVGQAVGTLLAAEASMGGWGAAGNIIKGSTGLASRAVATSKLGQAIAKPIAKFSELTSSMRIKPTILRGFDTVKGQLKAAPFSFAMAYDESQQIGHQVYEQAVKNNLERATGISKEDFYKRYKPQNGEQFSPSEYEGMDKDYEAQIVKPFMESNPEEFNRAISKANDASDLATTTNLIPETLGNMLIFNKFFKGKAITSSTKRFSPFIEKFVQTPGYKFAKQQVKSALGEGLLEEAGINMLAQRKGEYFTDGKYYSLDEYQKEIGGKEWTDNFLAGIMMGGPQSAIMSVTSGQLMNDVRTYREYKKVFNDYKELSRLTGKDELSNFLSLNLDAMNSQEFKRKEGEYSEKVTQLNQDLTKAKSRKEKNNIKTQIQELNKSFEQENNKFILTKINNAFQTGTTHKLISTLENMSQEENITDKEREDILDTVDSIKKLEVAYNEHIDKKDSGKIISNRFNDVVNRKQLARLDSELARLETRGTDALSRIARQIAREESRIYKAKPVEGSPDTAQWRDTTKVFKQRYESALTEAKEAFNQDNDLGDADLRSIIQLRQSKEDLEDALDKNQDEFNELISEEYQDKVDSRNGYYYDLSQLISKNLTEEAYKREKSRIVKRYSQDLDRKDFDAIDNEVNTKKENFDRILEEVEQNNKTLKDLEEKRKLEEENIKAQEAQAKLEQEKRGQTIVSEEERTNLEQSVPERSVPNVISEEEANELEQEKMELASEDNLTPEQESRLQEVETITTRNERNTQLDNLLNTDTSSQLSQEENDVLSNIFGIDPSTVDALPSFQSENISTKIGDGLEVNLDEEDENYSPNELRPNQDTNPVKNFIEDLMLDIANRERKTTNDVTAEEVLDELISVAGKDKAERAYNLFSQGYSLNHPDTSVDFDRLYNKYFSNRLATLDNLLDSHTITQEDSIEKPIVQEPVTTVSSNPKPRFDENNKPIVAPLNQEIPIEEMIREEQNKPESGRTNNPWVKKSNIFLGDTFLTGVLPTLFNRNLVFQSKNFRGLNIGNLFNFKNYKKYNSDKLPMTLSLPDNYKDIMVKDERDGFKLIPFGEWETKYGYTRLDDAWIEKVPILSSFEGQGTFYLNEANVADPNPRIGMNIWEISPEESPESITNKREFYKSSNLELRREVLRNGTASIQVKTNLIDIINDAAPKKLNQFSKDTLIGSWDKVTQVFKYKGNVIETINKDLSHFSADTNRPVILKPVGIDSKGNTQYQAFQVNVNGLLNSNHHASLGSSILTYLSRNIRASRPNVVQSFSNRLKSESNIDLENFTDLNNYINSIYKTSPFGEQAKNLGLNTEQDIKQGFANYLNDSSNKALPGQASIAIVDFKIVMAIKPNRGNINPENIIVIDPSDIKDESDMTYVRESLIKPLVRALGKSTSINISNSIRGNNKYFLMDNSTGNTIEYDSYDDYLRNYIEVPASAMSGQVENSDGSIQDIPTRYASLEITREGGFGQTLEEVTQIQEEQVIEENKVEEAREILEETKSEVSQEEIQALVDKIKKAEKSRDTLVRMNMPTDKVDAVLAKLRNDLSELDNTIDPSNYSVNIITGEQVQEMRDKEKSLSNDIPGLTLYEQNDITLNVFNEIAKSIGYQKGSKISKNKILSDIRNKVFGLVNQAVQNNNDTISDLQDLIDIDPSLQDTITDLSNKNLVLESLKDNYNIIEEEVLDSLEEKTGIKDVKDKSKTTLKEEDDNSKDSDLEEESKQDEALSSDIDRDIIDRDKDFNSSSLEVKGKTTVSAKMKRFLAGIPMLNSQGVPEKGFLGLVRFYDFRDLDNEIKVALNTPMEIDSDYNTVIAKLKSIQEETPWAKALLERLEDKNTPEQTRIEFMYNYTGRHSISSKFIQFEEQRGRFYTELVDANFTDITKNIRKNWIDNLKSDSIVYNSTQDGDYVADPTTSKRLYQDFLNLTQEGNNLSTYKITRNDLPGNIQDINSIVNLGPGDSVSFNRSKFSDAAYTRLNNTVKSFPSLLDIGQGVIVEVNKDIDGAITYSKPQVSDNVITNLSDWLNSVGINLNSATLTDLAYNGLDLGKDGNLNFYALLDPKNLKSPFSTIARNLDLISKRQDLGQSNSINDFNILDGAGNQLLALAKIESRHTKKVITKNFKDNGKLMQGLPIGKYATDRVKDLKDTQSGVLESLSKLSFSRNSVIMKLLQEDPEFNSRFQIIHTANGSFKRKGGKFQDSSKVSDLTAMDLEVAKLAYFFETNNVPGYNMTLMENFSGNKDTRIGQVFLPTMSDKDQMMTLQTIIFNINEFNYKDGQLNDSMLELLYSQLVKPDLDRIGKFHSNGGSTDIKGYDKAAQLFNLVSSMNSLKDENGDTLTHLMKRDPSLYTSEYIEAKYKDLFKQELNSLINHLVEEKLNKWKELEIIDDKNNIKIDDKYLAKRTEDKKNTTIRNRNLAAEFIINNLITNANAHMLIIGDPALYSQDKFFKKDKFKDGDPTQPIDTSYYREWSESSLGTNLGKRLALMLAPGNKLYNSKNEVYHQIYLKDFVDISSNIVDLIGDFYSEKDKEIAQELVDIIKESNRIISDSESDIEVIREAQLARQEALNTLGNNYDKLADYLDIESTDAQEYTTISEHINVMRRQGRIDDELFDSISKKLEAQSKEASQGLPISISNYLTKEELGQVLQPIKPVHTGQIFDEEQDVARTVYVKSSSFPLIPQLTYGKPIDGVRRVLEQYEARVNSTASTPVRIRASYDTANKVGATKNAISPFNLDGSFNEKDFNLDNINNARLELSRNNFRIQQDVPYKSDKGSEDRISYGTQMLKVLFSNGILDVKSGFQNPEWKFDKPNEGISRFISGQELFEKYNENFIQLVNIKKSQLYRELGLDSRGFVEDKNKFRNNIAKLLEKEGKKRDYSKNDLNSIKLNSQGEFVLPLFLNNQSTKIESLLLSIVANRVIKHKFPGYSYVAGSEAGFKLLDNIEAIEGRDRIIYVEGFSGELKGTTNRKNDGGINYAEVMVPSKIRNNKGELLNLYEKDKNGGYKYLNINPETKRFTLKSDMVQSQLLDLVTFRVPTSSHVSLSNVKVVGILPPESGDLILVPKNFTKQKGLDFDVDKENTYQLWTYVNQSGVVKELSEGYINYQVGKLKKIDNRKLANLLNEDSDHYKELLSSLGTKEAVEDFISNRETSMEEKIIDFQDTMKQKLIENQIIKIHSSVLGNPNKEVKNKINKILSMDFAKEQAENISSLRELGKKNSFIQNNITESNSRDNVESDYSRNNRHFTILSDDYQSYKMFLGSAGKSGIGVYSNFLTMASLFQQYGELGDFRLREYNINTESFEPLDFSIQGIGQVDGVLGRIRTLDGDRSISELFEELQNTATDNEKEQIMGRTGINNHTIGVFSIMGMLGIDKTPVSKAIVDKYNLKITNNKMSFGNLLLSQNVVNEIVSRLEYNNSNLTEFDNRKVIDIIRELKKNYVPTRPVTLDDTPIYDEEGEVIGTNTGFNFDLLTGDNLIEMIGEGNIELSTDFNYQVLGLLEKLYSFQDQFRNAQKILNISSNGLGLDLIENNNLNELLKKVVDSRVLSGMDKLLFQPVENVEDLSPENKSKIVFINEFNTPLLPTTPIGAGILNAFDMSKKLWSDSFPYQSRSYRNAIQYALSNTGIKGNSGAKVNFERKFAKEFKKYLNSNTNLYNGSTRLERERLFFDTPENTSLAKYLNNLLNSNNGLNDVIARNISNNPLIKKFTFDINDNNIKNTKNRFPSLIKYNDSNSVVENREVLYRALPELIEMNSPLPAFNGQPYSTRLLAQDLVNYSYLEGGIQEIQQFVKYIPISYLEAIGFTEDITNRYKSFPNYLDTRGGTPNFIRQFFQHNPEYVHKLTKLNNLSYDAAKAKGIFNALIDSELNLEISDLQDNNIEGQDFLVIQERDNRGKVINILFEKDKIIPTRFTKIPQVGYYGLSEYDSTRSMAQPLKEVIVDLPTKPNVNNTVQGSPKDMPNLEIGNTTTEQVVDNMLELDNKYTKVFEPFRNYIPEGLVIEIDDIRGTGRYSKKTNTITIHPDTVAKGPEFLSRILVKELVHSVTSRYVSRYLKDNGDYIDPNTSQEVPLPIRKLKVLYQELLSGGATLSNSQGVTLQDFVENYKKTQAVTQEDFNKFYGFTDIHEFMEMAMTEPNFRKFLDDISDIDSRANKQGFLDRLKDIFKDIWNNVTNRQVSREVVDTISEVIFSNENDSNIYYNNENNYSPIEDILSRAKNLLTINNNSNFAELNNDPFKCK